MRHPISILAQLVLMLFSMHSLAHFEEPQPRISVSGKGVVAVSPDMAEITMSVEARNLALSPAREEVTAVSKRVLRLLQKLDIDEGDRGSSGLNVRPQYRWNNRENRQELQGYLVQRDFQVTLRDLDNLGDLMEAAIDAGVNRISPPALSNSKAAEHRRRAMALAAADAEANAKTLAEALGVELGSARHINSQEVIIPPMPQKMMRAELATFAADAAAADTYQAGDQRYEVQVQVSFEIK